MNNNSNNNNHNHHDGNKKHLWEKENGAEKEKEKEKEIEMEMENENENEKEKETETENEMKNERETETETETENENIINTFIDDLTADRKPEAYKKGLVNQDTEKLFESIRAVKRLQDSSSSSAAAKKRRRILFKGIVGVAAMLIMAVGLNLFLIPIFTGDRGIVEAVVKAYGGLHSYSGVFEIRSERYCGEIDYLETIEIQYQKPGMFNARHEFNDLELHYISDGESMIAIEPSGITIEHLFPEKEIWRYHIGTVVNDLTLANDVSEIGAETLFGRETIKLELLYDDSGDGESHLLWIDTATNLPVRRVLSNSEGSSLIVEFSELEVNPFIDIGAFSWEYPDEEDYRELNQAVSLEDMENVWPDAASFTAMSIIEENGFELFKAGLLQDDFYAGVLRFRKKDGVGKVSIDYSDSAADHCFLDIYYTTDPVDLLFYRNGTTARLGSGYAEINPAARNVFERYPGLNTIGRWVKDNEEIFIVTNREEELVQVILETAAGEPFEVMP